jgi:hypothetical protein
MRRLNPTPLDDVGALGAAGDIPDRRQKEAVAEGPNMDAVGWSVLGRSPLRRRVGNEIAEHASETVGVLEVREVPGALEELHAAVGEVALDGARVRSRDHPVLGSPHDQGRNG